MYGPYNAQLSDSGSLRNTSFAENGAQANATPAHSDTRDTESEGTPGERHIAFELKLEGLLRIEALGALPAVANAGLAVDEVCTTQRLHPPPGGSFCAHFHPHRRS
jgi:hypothetical protein